MDERFWIQYGPIIAALIGGAFTLAGAFIQRAQPATRPRTWKFTKYLFIGLAGLSFLIFAILVFSEWAPKDRWLQWQEEVEHHLGTCAGNDASCLRETIEIYPPPRQLKWGSGRFYEDMRMGALLLDIPRAQKALRSLFGITPDTFTGSGYSIPWHVTYAQARAREYLVENLSETNEDVWTWQLEPAFANYARTVQDVLTKLPPTGESNQTDLGTYLHVIIKRMNNPDVVPPLIRFQQFPREEYQGTLGRPEAVRVFVSNLRDVWEMTVEQAAKSSGYPLSSPDSRHTDTKLFVWLYVPTHPDAAIRATWGNIMAQLPQWLAGR